MKSTITNAIKKADVEYQEVILEEFHSPDKDYTYVVYKDTKSKEYIYPTRVFALKNHFFSNEDEYFYPILFAVDLDYQSLFTDMDIMVVKKVDNNNYAKVISISSLLWRYPISEEKGLEIDKGLDSRNAIRNKVVPKIIGDDISFINDEHRGNFEKLMSVYGDTGLSADYQSNIYAAALPEIYKCFNDVNQINTDFTPLKELMEYDEKSEQYKPSHPALTGSTSQIVQFALSCYNGNHLIGMETLLNNATSDAYFNAIIEILKIRTARLNR